MTASVLVYGLRDEADTTQRIEQPTDGGSAEAHQHAGRLDCGCGRYGCHDEFLELAATTDAPTRTAVRDRLVEAHLSLAYRIAGHYRRPGPGFEDIRQVAALALLEAVNRFEPGLGTAFSAFAVPTIAGAIKRHFRDQRWTLHPPRRIKELRLQIRAATEVLTQRMRRDPTVADLAEYLECGQEEICEALCTDNALRPLSIDAPIRAADDDTTLAATLGCPDDGYARVEDRETLRSLLAELPERELRVITMRFFGNLTQSQIAAQVGCSQMHVSRILRAALGRLRDRLQDGSAGRGDDDVRDRNAGAGHGSLPGRHNTANHPNNGTADEVHLASRPASDCIPFAAFRTATPFHRQAVPTGHRQHPAETDRIRRRRTGIRPGLTVASVHLTPCPSVPPPSGRPPNQPARFSTTARPACRSGRGPAVHRPCRRRIRPSRSPPR